MTLKISDTPPAGRLCKHCGLVKPSTDFGLYSQEPDGRRRTCKSCMAEYMKLRRSTEAGKAENITNWKRSKARAHLRVGNIEQAQKLVPDLSTL